MAISTTTINGTDSVAASRITINDNFNTIKDSINELLAIVDTATGKINNYGFGSNNDIETEDLIVRGSGVSGGISVLSGNISVSNGNLVLGNGNFQIGSGSNAVTIQRATKSVTGGTVPTLNLSGTTSDTSATAVKYVTLPRLLTADIKAIQNPHLGSIVYDLGQNKFVVCTVTSSTVGATGTWTILTTGSNI